MTSGRRRYRANPIYSLFPILLLLLHIKTAFAIDMGDSLIRDYPVSLPIPKHRLEISLDYLRIDNTLDVFDAIEPEKSGESSISRDFEMSDMSGFRAFANFGLFEKTTLHAQFIQRDIEYGRDDLSVRSLDFAVKQNINNRRYGNLPYLSIDAGFRSNTAEPPDFISTHEWKDQTPYARLVIGAIAGDFYPNLFFEYGYATIDSELNPEYAEKLNDPSGNREEASTDTSRHESSFRTGLCILVRFPYTAMSRIEYRYLKLFRDGFENEPDDNHIFKFDMNFFITERIIFNFGNIYYHRQFNGVIPAIFSEYTQNSFDQNYFRFHIGFTVLFGID